MRGDQLLLIGTEGSTEFVIREEDEEENALLIVRFLKLTNPLSTRLKEIKDLLLYSRDNSVDQKTYHLPADNLEAEAQVPLRM